MRWTASSSRAAYVTTSASWVVTSESSAIPGSNHLNWFEYMAENMNDVLDAYSVHIYWNYWDIP